MKKNIYILITIILLVSCVEKKAYPQSSTAKQTSSKDLNLFDADLSQIDIFNDSQILVSFIGKSISNNFGKSYNGPHGGIALFGDQNQIEAYITYYTTEKFYLVLFLSPISSDKSKVSDCRVIGRKPNQKMLSLSGKVNNISYPHLLVITSADISKEVLESTDYVFSFNVSAKKITEITDKSLIIYNEQG